MLLLLVLLLLLFLLSVVDVVVGVYCLFADADAAAAGTGTGAGTVVLTAQCLVRRRSSWMTRIVAATAVLILLLNDYQTRLTAVNHTISNRTKTHTHLQTRIHMPASFIHTRAILIHNTHTHVLARGRTLLWMRRSLTLLPYFRLFLFSKIWICAHALYNQSVPQIIAFLIIDCERLANGCKFQFLGGTKHKK